jgi:hypothetical protein
MRFPWQFAFQEALDSWQLEQMTEQKQIVAGHKHCNGVNVCTGPLMQRRKIHSAEPSVRTEYNNLQLAFYSNCAPGAVTDSNVINIHWWRDRCINHIHHTIDRHCNQGRSHLKPILVTLQLLEYNVQIRHFWDEKKRSWRKFKRKTGTWPLIFHWWSVLRISYCQVASYTFLKLTKRAIRCLHTRKEFCKQCSRLRWSAVDQWHFNPVSFRMKISTLWDKEKSTVYHMLHGLINTTIQADRV